MPRLSGSVGHTGLNKKHDVAVVQAMLRVIKNPKGQPYVTFGYDGDFTPGGATFKAVKAFQEDHKTAAGPPPESAGKVELNSKTLNKMIELLPPTHKEMRALENFSLVYLPGTTAELNSAIARVTGDQKFTSDFKGKLVAFINGYFQNYGIVLSVNPDKADGGFRTFQQQRDLMDRLVNGEHVTNAGPGESNHNWGNGADVGFANFRWLKGDGSVVTSYGAIGDGPWLGELEKVNKPAAAELWRLKHQSPHLFRSAKAGDNAHVQSYSDSNVSMTKSLAEHLSIEGCMYWEYKQGSYWSNYGLADPGTKFRVGSAKNIWDKAVNVDEASLAKAMNQAEARRKISPLPGYEEEIRTGIVDLTPNPPTVWKASDIKKAHCDLMRVFFRVDFELSEANYTTWKPYDGNGNAL